VLLIKPEEPMNIVEMFEENYHPNEMFVNKNSIVSMMNPW
jgi:hypothetical protein